MSSTCISIDHVPLSYPFLLLESLPRQLAPTVGHGVYRAMMHMVISSATGGGSIPLVPSIQLHLHDLTHLSVLFISKTSKASQAEGKQTSIQAHTRSTTDLHEMDWPSARGRRCRPPHRHLRPRRCTLHFICDVVVRPPCAANGAVRLIVAMGGRRSLPPHRHHAWPPV